MVKMKKILFVFVAIIVVVSAAGTASAWGRGGGRMRGPGSGWGGFCFEGGFGMRGGSMPYRMGSYCGFYGPDGSYAPVIPQEIRDKLAEAQKTAIDLRTELGRNPVNRERALELQAQHRALMQEVHDWHFNQRLDALAPPQ